MLENLNDYRIVLASNSPRRRELLQGLGVDFTVRTLKDIDESYPSSLCGEEIPQFISRKKAKAYASSLAPDELLITADTVVYLHEVDAKQGKVLGKPKNLDEAREMLKSLSGRSHQVITGVSIVTINKTLTFASTSEVTFAPLTDTEIDYYVSRYKPLDKAGAYGIQEWIGYVGVRSLSGSYFNVMGLPVQRLYDELKKWPQR